MIGMVLIVGTGMINRTHSLKTIIFSIFLASLMGSKALAHDLPWGKSKDPTLITPGRSLSSEQNSESSTIRRTPVPGESRERYIPPRAENTREYNPENYGGISSNEPARDSYENKEYPKEQTFSDSEILNVGHEFFGSVSTGLAKVIERVFSTSGRPNGYILGEEAGGAFVAGLRYGEGILHTKYWGRHKVYWQGPSVGYDFGAEGSKTMVLVYDLRDPRQIYRKFSGVNGSAYLVGGIGLTYQKKGNVVLARIRSGVGLRLGANIGYLKYTRTPTWNPF